jgi:GNAT superfamily N-acetyltransferase
MRRIVTHREQVEMTAPWRVAANLEDYGDAFPSEEHVTNEDLQKIFGDTKFLASKSRMFNPGADEYHSMDPDQQIEHFNNHIIPLWQKHGLPIPGKGRYLDFQDDVRTMWMGDQGKTSSLAPWRVAATPLESINPTGGIFVDYDPQSRTGPHGSGVITYDKATGSHPDELMTIYRGAPRHQQTINPGDFVTDTEYAARDYAGGNGHVLRMQVPKSHVATDPDEWEGGEHIYSPRLAAENDVSIPYGLPPNMEFRLYDGPGMYGLNAAGVYYKNHPTGPKNWLSAITWKNGVIDHVETKPRHQGKGYASGLLQWIRDNHEPNLQHSTHLTDAGRGWAEKVGAFNPIEENFGPHYRPGKDKAIDNAANAYALWAGRLDDSNFDQLSDNMVNAINAAGFGPHHDPYDAMMELQDHLRKSGEDPDE